MLVDHWSGLCSVFGLKDAVAAVTLLHTEGTSLSQLIAQKRQVKSSFLANAMKSVEAFQPRRTMHADLTLLTGATLFPISVSSYGDSTLRG